VELTRGRSNLIHCAIRFTLFKFLSKFCRPRSFFKQCHYGGSIIGRKIQESFNSGVTTFE
jgi:hypothetical protein